MTSCLLVDDSKVTRAVLRSMLHPLGFTVSEAADGIEALAHCEAEPPAVVIVDWHMPRMDGLSFVKALRATPGKPDSRQPVVLFCTSAISLAHIQAGLEAGADEYIMKPFDAVILREKLQALGLVEPHP